MSSHCPLGQVWTGLNGSSQVAHDNSFSSDVQDDGSGEPVFVNVLFVNEETP